MYKTLLNVALLVAATYASAEPWKYSGSLNDGGAPANGRYDLRLTVLDAAKATSIGSPVTLYAVDVHDGAFTVAVDFGIDLANVPAMQLKTEVSKGSSVFVALGEPTRFDPKAALAGVCWDTEGNSGTNPAINFIGTTDDKPLVLRAKNVQALSIFPKTESPNFVSGSSANTIDNTKVGQVIAGGGSAGSNCGSQLTDFCQNRTQGNYSTVSGGRANIAAGNLGYGTVGGGAANTANGGYATIGGGIYHTASGFYTTVGGGFDNTASGNRGTVGGGEFNIASGRFSSISGGESNCAGGDNSWAGGSYARIRPGNEPGDGECADSSGTATGDNGTFVWADDQSTSFISTGQRQFLVRAGGGVAINTATKPNGNSPVDAELTITSNYARPDTNVEIFMYPRASTVGYLLGVQATQPSNNNFFITQSDGLTFTNRLQIDGNGTTFVQGGAVGNISDERLKKNIGSIARPLDKLLALQGHVYEYIDPAKAMNAPGPRMGFVAQEVQKVLPNWVKPTGNDGYLAVTPIGFEALAVEAMRDLKAESDVRIEALERQNASLLARLAALEAKVSP